MAKFINEYVEISYTIGSNVTVPENHRLINTLMNFLDGDMTPKIVFTKDNASSGTDRDKLTPTSQKYLDTFFAQDKATQLTVWNFALLNGTEEEIASVLKTDEKQVIIPKYDDPLALKGDMDKLATNLKDKYVYIHLLKDEITPEYKVTLPVTGRNLLIAEVEIDQGEWFDVLGNIGSTGNYIKFSLFNNGSTLQPLTITTLNSLISVNAGGLIYIDELSSKRYENLVDSTGLDMNYNFIREDIAYLVQIEVMKALDSVEIPYLQVGFNMVGNVMYTSALPILNSIPIKIYNLKVVNAIYNNQTATDKAIHKANGYIIKYNVVPQLRSVGINIFEVV